MYKYSKKKLELKVCTRNTFVINRENCESSFKAQANFIKLNIRNKRILIKRDPNILVVLPALLRVCSTVPEINEATNGTLRSEDSSAEDFAACVKASVHFISISTESAKRVPENHHCNYQTLPHPVTAFR